MSGPADRFSDVLGSGRGGGRDEPPPAAVPEPQTAAPEPADVAPSRNRRRRRMTGREADELFMYVCTLGVCTMTLCWCLSELGLF